MHERFSGTIVTIGRDFGFVRIDATNTDVFFHRDICDGVPFDRLSKGDRICFSVKESKTYPGRLVAGRITRDKEM